MSDRCGVTLDMTVLWQLVANKADRCVRGEVTLREGKH